MKYLMSLILLTFLLTNCSEDLSKSKRNPKYKEKDSLSLVIDSIRLSNLHKNFIGRHSHGLPTGQKDLAEHAHQNPAQKRRWRKKQFAGVKAKRAAMQRRSKEMNTKKEN